MMSDKEYAARIERVLERYPITLDSQRQQKCGPRESNYERKRKGEGGKVRESEKEKAHSAILARARRADETGQHESPGVVNRKSGETLIEALTKIQVGNEGRFLTSWRGGWWPIVPGLVLLFAIGYIRNTRELEGPSKYPPLKRPASLLNRSVPLTSNNGLSITTKEGRTVMQGLRAGNPPVDLDRVPGRFRVERARVSYIFDGDTISLGDGRRIRYIGIDTPEISHSSADQDEPGAREARTENTKFVGGKQVILLVPQPAQFSYDRLLAYVYAPYTPGIKKDGYSKKEYVCVSRVLYEFQLGDQKYGPPDPSLPVFLKENNSPAEVKTKAGRAK